MEKIDPTKLRKGDLLLFQVIQSTVLYPVLITEFDHFDEFKIYDFGIAGKFKSLLSFYLNIMPSPTPWRISVWYQSSPEWKISVLKRKDLILYSHLPFKHLRYFEILLEMDGYF
jgi:hypothetical protein